MYIVWSVSQHIFPAGLGRLGRLGQDPDGSEPLDGWFRAFAASSAGSPRDLRGTRLTDSQLRRELERQLQPDIRRKLFCFWFIVPKLQIDSRSMIRIFLNLLHGFTSFQYMLAPFWRAPKGGSVYRRLPGSSFSPLETDRWSRLQPSLAGTTSSQLSSVLVSTRLKFICYDREVRNLFGASADMLSQHVTTCHSMSHHHSPCAVLPPKRCYSCARSAHQSPSRRCGASEYWSDWSMCWEELFFQSFRRFLVGTRAQFNTMPNVPWKWCRTSCWRANLYPVRTLHASPDVISGGAFCHCLRHHCQWGSLTQQV